jgi:putative transposase
LTFCTADRARVFVDAATVSGTLSHILRAASQEEFALIAYCFMPDHLHIIAEGAAAHSDLKAFTRRAKQSSGYYHAHRTGRRLWQRYGYEHVIREKEDLSAVVRYILENPVRAGLAAHPSDYPFLGSSIYTIPELMDFVSCRRSG